MNIIIFPRLSTHRHWADLMLQNHEQAEEHRQRALKLSPLTEERLRWRREAHARWMLAHEERMAVRMQAVLGVA